MEADRQKEKAEKFNEMMLKGREDVEKRKLQNRSSIQEGGPQSMLFNNNYRPALRPISDHPNNFSRPS